MPESSDLIEVTLPNGKKIRVFKNRVSIRGERDQIYIIYYGKVYSAKEVGLHINKPDLFRKIMELYYVVQRNNGEVEFKVLSEIFKTKSRQELGGILGTLSRTGLIKDFSYYKDLGFKRIVFNIKIPTGKVKIWKTTKKRVYWSILDKDKLDKLELPIMYRLEFDRKYNKVKYPKWILQMIKKMEKEGVRLEEPQ